METEKKGMKQRDTEPEKREQISRSRERKREIDTHTMTNLDEWKKRDEGLERETFRQASLRL